MRHRIVLVASLTRKSVLIVPVCNKTADVSDRYERIRDAESEHLRWKYGVSVPVDGDSAQKHGAHLTDLDLHCQLAEKPDADFVTRFVTDEAHRACRDQWLARNVPKFPMNPTNGSRIYVSTETFQDPIGKGLDRFGKPITAIRRVMGVYRWHLGTWHEVTIYPRHTRLNDNAQGYLNRALLAINPHVARTDADLRRTPRPWGSSRDILQLFLSDEAGRQQFATEFTAMMHDDSLSFSKKYDRFVGDLVLEESKAQRLLEDAWSLAFGTPWVWNVAPHISNSLREPRPPRNE